MKIKLHQNLLQVLVICLLGATSHFATAQDGYIKGQVKDASGELPGVSVLIQGPANSIVLTDVDGTYSATVPAGEYTVSVDVMGYGIQQKTVAVREAQTAVANFQLSLNIGGVTASATLFEQSALDAPATVYVFTERDIRDRGYHNIQDLLTDVPEAEIQRKSMVEFKDNIGFRGITGNEKFIIFQDGVRITAATGDPHTVHTNYPLNNVKRVEVLVGPASAVYGVDAFSGLINIITKNGEEINGGRVMASYGSFNTLDNSFIIGQKIKELNVAVSGNFYRSDEPNFNEIYEEDFAWFNEQYLPNGNMELFGDTVSVIDNNREFEMPSSSYFINATANYKDFTVGYTRNGEMHSSSYPGLPSQSIYDGEAQYGFNIQSIFGKYNYTSTDEKLKLQTLVAYNGMENNVNSLFMNVYTGYEKGYKYQFGKTLRFEQLGTYVFNEKINLAAGFSYEDVTALPKTGDLPSAFDKSVSPEFQGQYYFGSNFPDANGVPFTIPQDFYYLQYNNIGGFVQLQASLSDYFQATLGTRYDYNTRYGASFNPRVAVLIKPTENLRIKALYNEAFLSPSPWKAYQHFGSFFPIVNSLGQVTNLGSAFFHLPNPDLQPEKLRSFEGNISYTAGSNWFFSLGVFSNSVSNVINYFAPDPDRTSFQGYTINFIETANNEGELTTQGGTVRVEYKQEFSPTIRVNAYVYYTYMDGEQNGQQVPYTAQNTIRIGTTVSANNFVISPRLVYRTASYSVLSGSDGNLIKNEPYGLVNMHIGYNALQTEKAQFKIFADVFNLLNTQFYSVSNIGSEGFPLAPQDPLRARLGIDVNF